MKHSLKWFVLSISIIIPLIISFFLHFFGKNNYEVPIFHEESVGNYSFCLSKVEFPFYVKSDSIFKIGENFVLIDIRLDNENQKFINNELERLINNNFILNVYSITSFKLDNDRKTLSPILTAFSPETRIIASPPWPSGVAMAAMVSSSMAIRYRRHPPC